MVLKIERSPANNKLKVSSAESKFTIYVTENELLNAVAHYYLLDGHNKETCPLCRKIKEESE